MWKELDDKKKAEYQKMIRAFASLSEMFAQKKDGEKNDDEDESTNTGDGEVKKSPLRPIINSKYQETLFQKVFSARNEDYGNTPYDVSINDGNMKAIIGIKTFIENKNMQKIMQFKEKNSIVSEWKSKIENDSTLTTEEQKERYVLLAKEISKWRNANLKSARGALKGIDEADRENVEAFYHVLMPGLNGNEPIIKVGELSYDEIEVDKIEDVTLNSRKGKDTSLVFSDSKHRYKYMFSDNQLSMDFSDFTNVETWEKIEYAEDAYAVFSKIAEELEKQKDSRPIQSCAWPLKKVSDKSGFNMFNGRPHSDQKGNFENFKNRYKLLMDEVDVKKIVDLMEVYLCGDGWKREDKLKKEFSQNARKIINQNNFKYKERTEDILKFLNKEKDYKEFESYKKYLKDETELVKNVQCFLCKINAQPESDYKYEKRKKAVELLETIGDDRFKKEAMDLLYRPINEVYIPLPSEVYKSNFFNQKEFILKFEPSGNEFVCHTTQENGKAIQSVNKQEILGKWLLRDVFLLKEREILTKERLEYLGKNGIKLWKYEDEQDASKRMVVHISFARVNKLEVKLS